MELINAVETMATQSSSDTTDNSSNCHNLFTKQSTKLLRAFKML